MNATLRHRLLLAAFITVALGMALAGGFTFWLSGALAAPVQRVVGPPPMGLSAEVVEFDSDSGARLRGWFVAGNAQGGGVVLMHGVRADRRSMIGRARFLSRHGYSVLLFDFQAHGESPGEAITFGHREARDAQAAVAFLESKIPGEPIGVIGVSLGGAASVLAPEPLPVDAMVLEAVYPDIEQAVENRLRMRLGELGSLAAPLLTLQLRPRLGVDPDRLRPVDGIGTVRCPVMIVAGAKDEHTTLSDSERLFRAAPSPKSLWVIPGAAHQDFHRYAGKDYEQRLLGFLSRYL